MARPYSALNHHPTPTPGRWRLLLGLTGTALAAYAVDTAYYSGTGTGVVLLLYPVAMLLAWPRGVVRVGTSVPV